MQMGDISSPTYPVHSKLELFLDQNVFGVNVPVKRTAKGYSKMPFPKIHMDYTYSKTALNKYYNCKYTAKSLHCTRLKCTDKLIWY